MAPGPTATNAADLAVTALKDFEGLKLQAYQDVAGVWTVGYGATGPKVNSLTIWTTDKAEADLRSRVITLGAEIFNMAKVDLTDPQLAALICLVYNIGLGAFKSSTLLKLLNAGDYQGAADQFVRWNKVTVNGEKRTLGGLVTRRARERDLFLSGTQGVTT